MQKAGEKFTDYCNRQIKEAYEDLKLFYWLKRVEPALDILPEHGSRNDVILMDLSAHEYQTAQRILRDYLNKQWSYDEIPFELRELAGIVQ